VTTDERRKSVLHYGSRLCTNIEPRHEWDASRSPEGMVIPIEAGRQSILEDLRKQ